MYAAVNGNQAMDLERDDLQGADDLVVKADERRMEMRRGKIIAVSLTVCAVGAGMTVNAYAASTTFEMRKKAVSLLGIITTSNYQANVTRGEFAELLVKASDYKEAANAAGTVSVFVDVSSKSQYSAAIRTAATNSWMSGYLGGNFKPDEGVTMRDAIKAVLGVLGYTNEDTQTRISPEVFRRAALRSSSPCPWILGSIVILTRSSRGKTASTCSIT